MSLEVLARYRYSTLVEIWESLDTKDLSMEGVREELHTGSIAQDCCLCCCYCDWTSSWSVAADP